MKSKKGKAIIEAEKDFKGFKRFMQWIGFLIMFIGLGLIITVIVKAL